ncbi:hypothetical protein GCM10009122_13340 [Fulvivirga kasyanovii]|uniref:Uncharacterized protein n=1 Tax=Fulvivirga kasyanovii TaxID=396812 RepID=A0ABW9RWA4_9BACT|nr:hypothetical protein [Fulvivirga kasyanovii]MTI28258.1 hypothetical protein [Fulvivirga kasyanovii]
MYNPTRRNKNIGTNKQGHGQNNELTIPSPANTNKTFYERLTNYQKVSRTINGNRFEFVIESTRVSTEHACTIDDIAELLRHVPPNDYADLKLIILRQPKRKEETLSPVWGRLIYTYEFEGETGPAIILEAFDNKRNLKWSKKLSSEDQKELERLREDGHRIIETKRYFEAEYELKNVRNTQLYRTLLHEIGHYKHYLQEVEEQGTEDEPFEEWEIRFDNYFKLPSHQKEQYAHRYAEQLRKTLLESKVIPFERIEKINPTND